MVYTAHAVTQPSDDTPAGMTVVGAPDAGEGEPTSHWVCDGDELGWDDDDLDRVLANQRWKRTGDWTLTDFGATAPVRHDLS